MKKFLIAIVLVAVTISIIAFTSYGTTENPEHSTQSMSELVTTDTPVKGDLSAPILLVEFGDFQCPNCGRFAKETAPLIEESYINSGKVAMAFRHFTVVGPDSKTAAMAAQCANDQGKFWEFHDELYRNQGHENSGWANSDTMKEIASNLGLEQDSFDSCLETKKHQRLVDNDLDLARQLKLGGTPSFLIVTNDGLPPQSMTGAYPYAVFQQIFDERLGE